MIATRERLLRELAEAIEALTAETPAPILTFVGERRSIAETVTPDRARRCAVPPLARPPAA